MATILSANRLTDGLMVFRSRNGKWVTEIGEAEVFHTTKTADAAFAEARADIKACLVLEAAPIEVVKNQDSWEPTHMRDSIRINGPTITPGAKLSTARPEPGPMEADDVSI